MQDIDTRRIADVTLRRMQGARTALARLDGLGPKQLGEDERTGHHVHACLVDALAYLGDVGVMPNTLDAVAEVVSRWQMLTFPGATLAGASAHLVQEAGEVRRAALFEGTGSRDDVSEELADVFFMLVQCATLANVDLGAAVAAKLAKNKARRWPTKPDADGVFNHVEDGDS